MPTDLQNIAHEDDKSGFDKMCYHCKHWTNDKESHNLGLLYGICGLPLINNGLMQMIKTQDVPLKTYITFGCNQFELK